MKRRKMIPVPGSAIQKGGNTHTKEEVRAPVLSGMYLKDVSKRLGVSKTMVVKYVMT